ncbi:MAG: TetR/AcrR family transcriptional regulator [Alphaproteobacteria bacterium]|nr:TetR/AcrR family transcriptional regulator [Alphaproteobacteria bacterium]
MGASRQQSPQMAKELLGKGVLIQEAAKRLFMSQGYSATSMDAIAGAAGVSKATLYAHFKSKQALFEAMVQERFRANMGENLLPLHLGDDPYEGLLAVARRFLGMLLSQDALAAFRLVLAESTRLPELSEAFYRSGPARTLQMVATYLDYLNQQGRLQVPDTATGADLFLGQLKGKLYLKCLLGLQNEASSEEIERHAAVAAAAFVASFAPVVPKK